MQFPPSPQSGSIASAGTDDLRAEYLAQDLFANGECRLRYWETDRTIVGGIIPGATPIDLPCPEGLKSLYFLERREAGIVNLGGPGRISVAGKPQAMAHLDALYLGRGVEKVSFSSDSVAEPSRFWLLSYPAHAAHPSRHVDFAGSQGAKLGTPEGANQRSLHKLIHPGSMPTCQVVMGVTRLASGSVWNTMPPHTHLRRSEVYLYFDVRPGAAVFHFMGAPQETRSLVVRDFEAVLVPPWSVHCGVGTANYSFVWGMGGENQEFADMDPAPVDSLR
ncbi:MAG TPA: 5-dehydro-4-deoxy-D-glucuronate isomerase [Opitutaceae bacterium]